MKVTGIKISGVSSISEQEQKAVTPGILLTRDEVDKRFNEANTKLSKADEELVKANARWNEAVEKIKKIDNTLYVVVLVLLFMVAGLLLDAWHFNSAVYKEYSEKTASVETTQKANEALLSQVQDLMEQSKQDREIMKQLLKK